MKLKVVSGKVLGKVFDLHEGEWTLGNEGAAIALDDHLVSTVHAKITVSAHKIVIEDLSTNGTFVNERKIQRCVIDEGDSIRIGRSVLKLHS